jgi:hypothetical protein
MTYRNISYDVVLDFSQRFVKNPHQQIYCDDNLEKSSSRR